MRNVLLQQAFYIRPTGTQISRGFKVHNVITCESKGQVVVSLGRHWVLFALGRHWVLTNGTWHVLLQSGNVFELGGITILVPTGTALPTHLSWQPHKGSSPGGFDGFWAVWRDKQFLCYINNLNFLVALQWMIVQVFLAMRILAQHVQITKLQSQQHPMEAQKTAVWRNLVRRWMCQNWN